MCVLSKFSFADRSFFDLAVSVVGTGGERERMSRINSIASVSSNFKPTSSCNVNHQSTFPEILRRAKKKTFQPSFELSCVCAFFHCVRSSPRGSKKKHSKLSSNTHSHAFVFFLSNVESCFATLCVVVDVLERSKGNILSENYLSMMTPPD